MRKARKPLCLLLCAVLLLSMSAAALGANNNYSSWFQTNYDEINKLGLMPASFNGLDLTKNITRGEMCELAVYAFEKATGNDIDMSNETFTGFTDTSDENIVKAHLYGIVNGYEDGSFRPKQLLTRQEMPVICLDFHDPFVTTDAIVSDNAFGAAQLTYWLIEQGHRDIGFVGDIKATSSIMERYLGFLSAMLMKDLPVRPECVFSDRSPEGNMFHTFQLPEKMPTAFVVNCDMSAQALITDLQSRGYRVPEDISVVGFDDFCPTAGNTPPLTTFRVNCPAMCRMAVKLIGERCAGDRKTIGRVVIGGECVFRDSAAPVSVIH